MTEIRKIQKKHDEVLKGSSQGGRLLGGSAILGLSVLIVKIIGLIYKIPLLGLLGTEGMGYFNSAYEVYLLFCVIATAGLPTALSIVISGCRASSDDKYSYPRIKRIYRSALTVFSLVGALGGIALLIGADAISCAIGNSGARDCIAAIAPSALFICITSTVRGYFQGHEDMKKTAVSQVIEALGKLVLGLSFAAYSIRKGKSLAEASAYAIFGLTIGTAVSTLYLVISRSAADRKRKAVNEIPMISDSIAKGDRYKLFSITLPITLGAALSGVTRLADTALIMHRLKDIGYAESVANSMYGSFSTLALPIASMPPALISGVALSLIPLLTAAVRKKDTEGQKELILRSFKINAVFSVPASLGICAFSKPILELIYKSNSDAVGISYPLLSILGISVFFVCMINTTNAILQAYGHPYIPIVSMLIGTAVKLVFGYVLIGMPEVAIAGAPISTVLCNMTILAVNYCFIVRFSPVSEKTVTALAKPLLCSAVALLNSLTVYRLLLNVSVGGTIASIAAISLTVLIYAGAVLVTHTVDIKDIIPQKSASRKESVQKNEDRQIS